MLDFGAFVEIEKGVEGLVHVSEISEERVEDPRTVRQAGPDVKAEIIGVDTAERKIGLSIRGATRAEELADAQGFSGGVPTATLGDVMRDKLAALTGKPAEEGGGEAAAAKGKKGKAPAAAADDEGDDERAATSHVARPDVARRSGVAEMRVR